MGSMIRPEGGLHIHLTPSSIFVESAPTISVAGAWVELISSAPHSMNGIYLTPNLPNSAFSFLDLAIGSIGSEVIIVEGIVVEEVNTNNLNKPIEIPIAIQAGSRLSVRLRNENSSSVSSVYVHASGYGSSFGTPSTYNIMENLGRSVMIAGVSPAYGNYVEINSSLSKTYKSVIVGVDHNNEGATGNYALPVEIAIGAAASEERIIGPLIITLAATDDSIMVNYFHMIPITLSAGERISARSHASVTSGDEDKGITIWGLR